MDSMRWTYLDKVRDFLKPGTRILDLGGGGGEMLLRMLWENRAPAAGLGEASLDQLLEALGVTPHQGGTALPFPDGSFQLVLCRHQSYRLDQIWRVLVRGGFFLTQQIGGRDSQKPGPADFNLENQLPLFRQAGFRVMYRNQSYQREGEALRHRFIIIAKKK